MLDGFLYAVGGQDGVQCLNHVERLVLLKDSYLVFNFTSLRYSCGTSPEIFISVTDNFV